MTTRPLILFTNDDGIDSPGLWAVVKAFTDLGEILVCAPREQQSGTGRSLPVTSRGSIHVQQMTINGDEYTVYAVDGTPAQSVQQPSRTTNCERHRGQYDKASCVGAGCRNRSAGSSPARRINWLTRAACCA